MLYLVLRQLTSIGVCLVLRQLVLLQLFKVGELSSLGATSPVATNLKWWIYLVLGQPVLWQLFKMGTCPVLEQLVL